MKTGLEGKTGDELEDLRRRGYAMVKVMRTLPVESFDVRPDSWEAAGFALVDLTSIERTRRALTLLKERR